MRKRLSGVRVTPGLVVSMVAVFFAIGGIGYAASKIGTADIQRAAVTKAKVAPDAINSKRIENKTINFQDLKFSRADITGAQGPRGPQGPKGATGPQGPAGPVTVQADSQAKIATAQASPTLDNGGIVPLAVNEGFAWAGVCKDGASGTPGTGSLLVVQNLSGGDDSHISGALLFQDANGAVMATDQSDDFDQGEVAVVGNAFTDNTMSRAGYTDTTGDLVNLGGGNFAPRAFVSQAVPNANPSLSIADNQRGKRGANIVIYGSNGETQSGIGATLRKPTGFPDSPACVASLNLLSK